jgi:hypothetical protein
MITINIIHYKLCIDVRIFTSSAGPMRARPNDQQLKQRNASMSEATTSTPETRLSGREAAIARRQALSRYGKAALPGANAAGARSATEARRAARQGNPAPAPVIVQSAPRADTPASSGGCQNE